MVNVPWELKKDNKIFPDFIWGKFPEIILKHQGFNWSKTKDYFIINPRFQLPSAFVTFICVVEYGSILSEGYA